MRLSRNLNDLERTDSGSVSVDRGRERDSVVIRDSVIIWMQGDTVVRERWRTEYRDRWRDRWRQDTVWRDSVRTVEQVLIRTVEREVVPEWMWVVWAGIVVVFGVWIVKRLNSKVWQR